MISLSKTTLNMLNVLEIQLDKVTPGCYIGTKTLNNQVGNLNAEEGDNHLISINPTNNSKVITVAGASKENYQEIIKQAIINFDIIKTVPAPKRGKLIQAIGLKVEAYKHEIAEIISFENGKILPEALGEVQEVIDYAELCQGLSREIGGNLYSSERSGHKIFEQWHPLGLISIITAFNFPMAVFAWNAFSAIIAGNVCIWKPSLKTPLCAIVLHKICALAAEELNLPSVSSLIIPSDDILTEYMVNDSKIPMVSFTGSTKIGRKIYETISKRFGRCILELGGNNAAIVDSCADLDLALNSILFSAVGTAGQRCTTTRRLFVHQSLYKEFKNLLIEKYSKLVIGDPFNPNSQVGPLIDKQAVENYEKLMQDIVEEGGTILTGGNVIKGSGFFVKPTVVEDITFNSAIVAKENFVPILFLFPITSIKEAIEMNNSSEYGLSSALYTNSISSMEFFLSSRGSDCGIANINTGTSGAEIGLAFGGEKLSGIGREAGVNSWKYFMRQQSCTVNYNQTLLLSQGIEFNF